MSNKIASLCVLLIVLLSSTLEIRFASSTASGVGTDSYPKCSDVNRDGIVNILDIYILANAWNCRPGDLEWNAAYDLNDDGVVNIVDMVKVMKDFDMKRQYYYFDGAEDLNSWNALGGTWNILDSSLEGASTYEGLICAKDVALKDCMLTAGVKILADSPTPEVVLGICFVDADNFYWAGLGCWGHRVSISRTLGSVPEELAYSGSSADVGREVWYKVSVSVSGGTIMLFVDDILQLTMNDLISASGTIGIRTYDSHVAVDYVTVSYYGKMSEPSLRVRGSASSWNLGEYSAETVAETFGMSSSWWVPPESDYSAKMNQVHAMNPKYKALVYRDISSVYDYWADEWSLASNNGWLLKDSSGNYVTWQSSYLVDITNPDYQKWVATKIKSWLVQYPFFDGVSADNGLKASASDWGGDGSDRPMNPRTGTYFTDDEISNGYAQTLSEIISAIGTSKLLLPNGIWNGEAFFENGGNNGYRITLSKVPQLNALGSEGIFFQSYAGWWYDEAKWLKSVDMIVWMQDNFLDKHPERRFNAWVPVDSDVLPPGTTREQLMMWGFCSMLLGAKTDQNTIGFGKGIYKYPSLMTLLQKLQNIDMVEPLGNYYKIPSTSIYARDFAKGKVLVNPTDISYTITLERSYTTFYGSTVSGSLTIDSHTGVILFE